MAAKAKRDIRCLARDDVMTISCSEKLSEDTDRSLCRFRIHFYFTFTSLALAGLLRCGEATESVGRTAQA
jgi:hypothetical protein